jgi:ketosteroid isomerase-like protein
MKKSILLLLFITSFAQAQTSDTDKINKTLDTWHKAAADASFEPYFALMTDDAIFIGTDATENWKKADFKVWAKPFFDKGKAWNFTALERHIFFDATGKTAWFDELLDTQMKICRGSGVMVKVGKEWKVKHYVLSMTVPNDDVNEVVKIKAPVEDVIISKLKKK